jgi:hypothetical protein
VIEGWTADDIVYTKVDGVITKEYQIIRSTPNYGGGNNNAYIYDSKAKFLHPQANDKYLSG